MFSFVLNEEYNSSESNWRPVNDFDYNYNRINWKVYIVLDPFIWDIL